MAALLLFRNASPKLLAALAKRAVKVEYSAGTVIFLAGSTPRGSYMVLEECARVVRESGGPQHVVHMECIGGATPSDHTSEVCRFPTLTATITVHTIPLLLVATVGPIGVSIRVPQGQIALVAPIRRALGPADV